MAEISDDNISPTGCIDYANRLIELCNLSCPRISFIQNIDSKFFVSLFECITGLEVPDLLLSNDSVTEAHNIQAVINTLSLDLLNMDLSHLTGEKIVSGDIIAILNLFELLEAMFLHAFSKKDDDLKVASVSAEELGKNVSVAISPTEQHIRKAASVKSLTSSSDEHIPVKRVLKRKTCKNTLRKYHQNPHIPEKKIPEASQINSAEPSHSKRHSDTVDSGNSPLKRKISKPSSRTVKRPHTEGIEQLYELNFEMKVKTLLHSDKSPMLRAQQMKNNFIHSLKTAPKKTHVPPCKKSFLLPHNLRPKNKSSVRQSPTRKRTSQKKGVKQPISENTAKSEKDEDAPAIFQFVLDEFPGFKFPKNTLNILTKHYYHHVGQMHKQLKNTLLKKPTTLTQTEKAMEDEAKLRKILVKDLNEKKYLRELNEQRFVGTKIKCGFRDAKIRSAKTRQYFEEFHSSMKRKLQKRNYSEEVLVERTFKEILDQQKKKVRLLCQRVKETDEQDAKQHREYLNALKNLYREQLDLLAESVNAEQKDSSERAKAQELAIGKMNQEMRKELQREVRSLQKDVLEMIEDIEFRELDAQNFIRSFQQED